MESKRIEYIDVAKFIAIVLVMFTHGFKEGSLLAFACSFHLPLFYFLNGMTLKMGNQSFGEFLSKKLRRYIVPMLGLGILCVLSEALAYTLLEVPLPDNYSPMPVVNCGWAADGRDENTEEYPRRPERIKKHIADY